MAKLIIKLDTRAVEKAIKECKKIANKKQNIQPIADLGADLIRKRTALGRGSDGPLDPLSDSYKQARAGNVKFQTNKTTKKIYPAVPKSPPRLSSLTSSGKSNLTQTRQMLDAIFGQASTAKFTIEVNDGRGPDMYGNPSTLTNSQLVAIHEKGATIRHPSGVSMKIPARPFFSFTKDQRERLEREYRKVVQNCLRQLG